MNIRKPGPTDLTWEERNPSDYQFRPSDLSALEKKEDVDKREIHYADSRDMEFHYSGNGTFTIRGIQDKPFLLDIHYEGQDRVTRVSVTPEGCRITNTFSKRNNP